MNKITLAVIILALSGCQSAPAQKGVIHEVVKVSPVCSWPELKRATRPCTQGATR